MTRSSGGHTRHGSIPQGANRWVRGALVSAIPSHVRTAPHSSVTRAYEQLTARLGWRVARVAAARKLLRIIYVMLRRSEAWRSEPPQVTTSGTRSRPNMSLDDLKRA